MKKIFLLLSFMLLLNGCAALQSQPQNYHQLTWHDRNIQLNKFDKWDAEGKLSISYQGETDIASFNWQQNKNNYLINISSPLNIIHFSINGDNTQVTLAKSKTEIYTATNPEKLLQQQIGWQLPISNLMYWIKAIAAPKISYQAKFDIYNHLVNLKQQGWIIHYSDFNSVNNIDLPTKIMLQNSELKIKISVKNWR